MGSVRGVGLLALLSGVMLTVTATPGVAAPAKTATITVVHGLPGFTADIYVDGKRALNGFRPKSATDPIQMVAGRYRIDVRSVGSPATSKPVLSAVVSLAAGRDYTIAAHLTPFGKPALRVFVNDVSPIPAGRTRLILRDLADTPALDVALGNRRVAQGLTDPDESHMVLAAGSYSIKVLASADGQTLLGPRQIALSAGADEIIYVIGASGEHTLDLMRQQIADLGDPPADVPSGTGGLAAPAPMPVWARGLIMLAVVGVAMSIATLARRRPAA